MSEMAKSAAGPLVGRCFSAPLTGFAAASWASAAPMRSNAAATAFVRACAPNGDRGENAAPGITTPATACVSRGPASRSITPVEMGRDIAASGDRHLLRRRVLPVRHERQGHRHKERVPHGAGVPEALELLSSKRVVVEHWSVRAEVPNADWRYSDETQSGRAPLLRTSPPGRTEQPTRNRHNCSLIASRLRLGSGGLLIVLN